MKFARKFAKFLFVFYIFFYDILNFKFSGPVGILYMGLPLAWVHPPWKVHCSKEVARHGRMPCWLIILIILSALQCTELFLTGVLLCAQCADQQADRELQSETQEIQETRLIDFIAAGSWHKAPYSVILPFGTWPDTRTQNRINSIIAFLCLPQPFEIY